MAKKEKLLEKLLSRPANFTWDDAVTLMKHHNFELIKNSGSRRRFRHANGTKISLHEPHPQNTLLKYAMDDLIAGLKASGEIK